MSAGKTSMPQEFKQLADISRTLLQQTSKPRKELLSQLTEALRTGGVRAKIPLIQQAVSQSNQATSTALRQTSEELAKRNIGGPFASRALAGTRLAGEQATAAIPTNVAQQLISQTTPFLSATQSLGAGGLAQAGQASFASDAFNAQQFKALMEDIKDSLMGAGQMGKACLDPETPIETPRGEVMVKDLYPGDTVYSRDAGGARIEAKIVMTADRHVGPHHVMLLARAPKGEFYVTPMHPLPDGKPVGHLVGGSLIVGITQTTCDIEVDGPTGVYFVKGLALGSTLDLRHKATRRAA